MVLLFTDQVCAVSGHDTHLTIYYRVDMLIWWSYLFFSKIWWSYLAVLHKNGPAASVSGILNYHGRIVKKKISWANMKQTCLYPGIPYILETREGPISLACPCNTQVCISQVSFFFFEPTPVGQASATKESKTTSKAHNLPKASFALSDGRHVWRWWLD
jgi:hypothetical protein